MASRPSLQAALSSPAVTHRSQRHPLQPTSGTVTGPPEQQSPPLPSSLSDFAAVGLDLVRDDGDERRLADQTSHLTLPILLGDRSRSAQASSASGPGGAVPEASRGHSQAFSTLPPAREGPLPPQHVRQSAPSVQPPPSTVVVWHPASNDAQPAQPDPPISHEHAREEARMRDGGQLVAVEQEETGHRRMQAADPATITGATTTTTTTWFITDVIPGWTYEYPWAARGDAMLGLANLPNELLLHILSFLDVSDLLATSRTSHHFRSLALAPIIHRHRLRHARAVLPPLLTSPSRPSLSDLMARSIFLTNTTVVSRKLARSLTAIRLSRRLAVRPPPEALVARSVLPPECVPGQTRGIAPALVAKTRAVERERIKDGLRKWVGSVWERRWREKAEDRRRWEERSGVGRVWRLRRFWERVGRGEIEAR